MSQENSQTSKGRISEYLHLRGLAERAYRLNKKKGKKSSVGAIKTITVQRVSRYSDDCVDVFVSYMDGNTGAVYRVPRVSAEGWAKKVGKRVGARVVLPAGKKV